MTNVFIGGRGLISTLGSNLQDALIRLEHGNVAPNRFDLNADESVPYYAIEQRGTDWFSHVHALVAQAVSQTGATEDKSIPLFIASSSLDTGAIEAGASIGADCNVFAARIARELGWQGPVFTVSTACTSSLNAMLSAFRMMEAGVSAGALIVSIELANRYTYGGFKGMQLLAPHRALPFGVKREGLVLGEAVVALRLRNTPTRWRLRGGANVVDGRDPTGAVPQAIIKMCERALATSGVTLNDIGLIKVQAAGSPTTDATEAHALAKVFARVPPIVSLKHVLGHTLGASGAAEIALLTACLEKALLPVVDYPIDPLLGMNLASSLTASPRFILASILGFGGGHTALVLEDTQATRQ